MLTTFLLIAGIYLFGVLGLKLYDTFIGFNSNTTNEDNSILNLLTFGWPVFLPMYIIDSFSDKLDRIKQNRLKKKQVRIQVEKDQEQEYEAIYEELEKELNGNSFKNKLGKGQKRSFLEIAKDLKHTVANDIVKRQNDKR